MNNTKTHEIITKQVRWGEVTKIGFEVADNVIKALTASGFRIIGPDELDPITVEKAAIRAYECFYDREAEVDQDYIPNVIRALIGDKDEKILCSRV